jgi:hypothetical protein
MGFTVTVQQEITFGYEPQMGLDKRQTVGRDVTSTGESTSRHGGGLEFLYHIPASPRR